MPWPLSNVAAYAVCAPWDSAKHLFVFPYAAHPQTVRTWLPALSNMSSTPEAFRICQVLRVVEFAFFSTPERGRGSRGRVRAGYNSELPLPWVGRPPGTCTYTHSSFRPSYETKFQHVTRETLSPPLPFCRLASAPISSRSGV